MADQTKKKQRRFYDLSEVEKFLLAYEKWYEEHKDEVQTESGGQPDPPPPPPPGHTP